MLPEQRRSTILDDLSEEQAHHLLYDWQFWARPNQLPPSGDWFTWLLLAGRGFGKTRTGAEWVRNRAFHGPYEPIALIGQTKADVRDVMVEAGDSSILRISPPWFMPKYEPSKRRVTWPNGVMAHIYSGDEPDQLRGPQHGGAWVDELAKFRYPQETWDNMEFGLRAGDDPQVVVTTTPRPIPIIKRILGEDSTVTTRGSSYENIANLAAAFAKRILERYEGTYLGRQEIHAEILEDAPGALWKRAEMIGTHRVLKAPEMHIVGVGVDPPGGATECGIVVAGAAKVAGRLHGYVLEDASLQAPPDAWARAAVTAYHRNRANSIIAETNFGGDMVAYTISTIDDIPVEVRHAARGKAIRAEPIAALYQQGRIHHVGTFGQLEDELCSWVPGEGMSSPNRLDALVWVLAAIMLGPSTELSTAENPFYA